MRLVKKSIIRNGISVLRFLLIRFLYTKSFGTDSLGMIGRNCRIYISGKLLLGKRVIVSENVELQSKGMLSIGAYSTINRSSRIVAFDKIEIGHHVTMAQFVTVLDHDHAYEMKNDQLVLDGYTTAPIKIGNHVWIGDKVTITKGVTIGDNVIIGAHALVNKDIPNNCIAGGIPCKVLKSL